MPTIQSNDEPSSNPPEETNKPTQHEDTPLIKRFVPGEPPNRIPRKPYVALDPSGAPPGGEGWSNTNPLTNHWMAPFRRPK